MNERIRFGVIGGSGVYKMEAFEDVEEITLDTPFGPPSDSYIVGTLHGQRVAFLARHGRGHSISPSRLNQRANIYGFKMLGVEYLIGVSASAACANVSNRDTSSSLLSSSTRPKAVPTHSSTIPKSARRGWLSMWASPILSARC